jgi:dolichol-phosphate mannosyltransferase
MAVSATPMFSLVLPTYNERPNVPGALARVARSLDAAGHSFEIIVVDDDSPDETWKVAEEIAATDPRIRVLRRRGDRGLATAVAAGWRLARGRVLGVMDADLQYPPETLPTLLEALDRAGADIAICSRYAPGATVQHWSAMRWVISWSARLVGRLLLPGPLHGIADPGAGYFLVRRHVIEGVDLRPRGFKILIEVLARGRHTAVVEVGLPYEGRKEGQSKFRGRQVVEYLAHLTDLARDTGEGARSIRRVAVELGAATLGLGVLWALAAAEGVPYLIAAAVAAEVAILGAFAGTALSGTTRPAVPGGWAARLGRWQLRRTPGAVAGLLVLAGLTEGGGLHYLASAVLAVPVTALVNCALAASRRHLAPGGLVATTSP